MNRVDMRLGPSAAPRMPRAQLSASWLKFHWEVGPQRSAATWWRMPCGRFTGLAWLGVLAAGHMRMDVGKKGQVRTHPLPCLTT